ncbi:hypothetical protein PanWU01x14_294220 [Parasponia andersonii]|uniref:Uncharacterized protein n=1 Tax=Parasponia andersonii TaxID=3476 RepID=A0A2P5AWA5_PARAD|nr:hypothetical protein PanWU01x14_294220 [Parasponia andersonii]
MAEFLTLTTNVKSLNEEVICFSEVQVGAVLYSHSKNGSVIFIFNVVIDTSLEARGVQTHASCWGLPVTSRQSIGLAIRTTP